MTSNDIRLKIQDSEDILSETASCKEIILLVFGIHNNDCFDMHTNQT